MNNLLLIEVTIIRHFQDDGIRWSCAKDNHKLYVESTVDKRFLHLLWPKDDPYFKIRLEKGYIVDVDGYYIVRDNV